MHKICLDTNCLKDGEDGFAVANHCGKVKLSLGFYSQHGTLKVVLSSALLILSYMVTDLYLVTDLIWCLMFIYGTLKVLLIGRFKQIGYDQVTNYLDMVIFFLKKLLWGPRRPKIRDFGYHGP